MKQGLFITFEGGEGAGKSTQVQCLAKALETLGHQVIVTREPGGTQGAESIRNLLVQGSVDKWLPESELLLHFAARADHAARLIKPALDKGDIVICDRFTDSTYAYQAYGHGLPTESIGNIDAIATGNLTPDITFLLDITPQKGIKRASKRKNDENRYENMDFAFHERVHEGFLQLAAQHAKRYTVLDATDSVENISQRIIEVVTNHPKIGIPA